MEITHFRQTGIIRFIRTYILLYCLVLFASCDANNSSRETTNPVPRTEEWWIERNNDINALAQKGGIDLVFLGDSIMHAWETQGKDIWDAYYADRNAANFGMSGDKTQHVLWRIQNGNFDGINPKLIIIMIGTNNSSDNSVIEIAAGVIAIVKKLREIVPQSKILLLGIFPRGKYPDDPLRKKNDKTNILLAGIADGRQIVFLNIGFAFKNIFGIVSEELMMPDYLHLSKIGYQRWAEAIESYVIRMMEE